jgi:phage gp36-like protein
MSTKNRLYGNIFCLSGISGNMGYIVGYLLCKTYDNPLEDILLCVVYVCCVIILVRVKNSVQECVKIMTG